MALQYQPILFPVSSLHPTLSSQMPPSVAPFQKVAHPEARHLAEASILIVLFFFFVEIKNPGLHIFRQ
jgi:hypothetical protein